MKTMDELLAEWAEHVRQLEIQRTSISGYCGCCGEPNHVDGTQQHDPECFWYVEEDDKNE